VACTKCDRKGRLSVLRLLAEHGPDISLPDLREHVAADCPRLKAREHGRTIFGQSFERSVNDRCD